MLYFKKTLVLQQIVVYNLLIGGGKLIRLKELRLKKKLSQSDIANLLEVTQQAYANYERGAREADYKTLMILADFFDVSIDYLLGREVKESKQVVDVKSETLYPILEKYKKLNAEGKRKVNEYIEDLISSGNYVEEYAEEIFPS